MKYYPITAILFLVMCTSHAQKSAVSDFTHGDIQIEVDPWEKAIRGQVQYRFQVLEKTDSIYLDARNMVLNTVELNGRKARYSYNGRQLAVRKNFRKDREYELKISYSCRPEQAVYFLGWKDSIPNNEQVWTQGQGKYNSHWVPSVDLMTDKIIFSLTIDFEKGYEVIANGKLNATEEQRERSTWRWAMEKPMSSYLLAFAIGKYGSVRQTTPSGIPVELYFYPADSLLVEPTYRYSSEIFTFLEKEIGVDYPWHNYKMVPVRDFLYAGMENTGATFFSDAYVIDSTAFTDRNFINVNAHELSHQWFGNLVTERDASSHWLHEGFASYYAWLAQREFLGEDHYFWMLYDKVGTLEDQARGGGGESLLDPGAGSLTFYDKGGLALLALKEFLGEQTFKEGIRVFLKKFAYRNAGVSDFLETMEATSGQDLTSFRSAWLESTAFPASVITDYIRTAYAPIDSFIMLRNELTSSTEGNEQVIHRYWEGMASPEFRRRVLQRYHHSLSDIFMRKAYETGGLKVRQALSGLPGPIPDGLLTQYESLLGDKSYETLENALYKLWILKPDSRSEYLERTQGIIGFPNKNIRQLWLLLAILTRDYGTAFEKEKYREELFGYTASHYSMEVRQLAFSLIGEVFPYTRENLRDLVNAAVHPSWQFREFARYILGEELKKSVQMQVLFQLLDVLEGKEYDYLSKQMKGG
jgi:aminopeptidase N